MDFSRMKFLRHFSSRIASPLCGACLVEIVIALLASPAFANVVGTDMQNFNPITSGLDFVTVQSSETLKPGIVNLGLFLNYAVDTLPYFQNSPQGALTFNDTVTGLDLNAGLGLMRNWDVGISLPQVLSQNVYDQNGPQGQFSQTGNTELRVNTKVHLLGDDSYGIAVIGSAGFNRIQDNPWTGENPGPTFDGEIAADITIDKIAYGVNAGYRLRNPGSPVANSGIQPLQNQFIASAAASYLVTDWDTKVIGEIFGSYPAQSTTSDTDRSLESLEALAGIKHDFTTHLAFHAGGGAGLISGIASPEWRVYTGINYTFGPLWGGERAYSQKPLTATEQLEVVLPGEAQRDFSATPIERFRTQAILFEFDSDRMIGSYDLALEELANHLKSGFRELIIEGHTDSIGKIAYNDRLSLSRATAIKHYLVKKFGVDILKIHAVGYGPRRPIADNGNYQGRQKNRRVEFEISR